MKNKLSPILLLVIVISIVLLGFIDSKKNSAIGCKIQTDSTEVVLNIPDFTVNSNKSLNFKLNNGVDNPIKESTLKNTTSVKNLIKNYPSNWIDEVVEISLFTEPINQEQVQKTSTYTSDLSKEQINLLKGIKVNEKLQISLVYKSKNAVTNELDQREMFINLNVVPEQEALFEGGIESLIKYLKNNGLKNIYTHNQSRFNGTTVSFEVNKAGWVVNYKLWNSTGLPEADVIIVNLFSNMPQWKPSVDLYGNNITQKFELFIGGSGNGC